MQRHYSYSSQPSAARVVAVLGPTNTGKTYLALDRMLGHGSGMMGFPLRLLARENYDRAVAIKGPRQVALITGEEKIVPPYAKYFFCTVESMPLDKRLAFVAVDEIQLAADPDRGHVFTERLLRARGEEETMFMGAGAVRSLIRRLVPEATFISRPRFSVLSFTGTKKILRLPPRCAVVGFSAQDVYTIAELIRRERGGAGIRIAIDDFGTGYSSLSYLRRFPIDKIKIDRSFMSEAETSADARAIIRAVAGLGVSLGITTVVEGVETAQQLELARAEGVGQVQGYLLGRPQPQASLSRAGLPTHRW